MFSIKNHARLTNTIRLTDVMNHGIKARQCAIAGVVAFSRSKSGWATSAKPATTSGITTSQACVSHRTQATELSNTLKRPFTTFAEKGPERCQKNSDTQP